MSELFQFVADYDARVRRWHRATTISSEDRRQLVDAIHQGSNELALLAQMIDGR
jgi:hypothetical protein